MRRNFTFDVTQDYIDTSMPGSETRCAIADAWRASDRDLRHVRVTRDRMSASDNVSGERTTWRTPQDVAQWLEDWDEGRPVDPCVVRLRQDDIIRITETQGNKPRRNIRLVDPSPPKTRKPGEAVSERRRGHAA